MFVNIDDQAAPLEDYLEDLPWHFAQWPLEDRYLTAHIVRTMPCNWKVALEAFIEAYHTMAVHPQLLQTAADSLTEYDVYGPHVSRMITAVGVNSEHLGRELDDVEIIRAMLGSKDAEVTVEPGSNARKVLGERVRASLRAAHRPRPLRRHRRRAARRHRVLPLPQLHAVGRVPDRLRLPLPSRRPRPRLVRDRHHGARAGPDGDARPAAPATRHLGPDESWSDAPELGVFGRVFNQDGSTFGRIQRGLQASVRPTTTLGRYQESRIRHFHATLDAYLDRA